MEGQYQIVDEAEDMDVFMPEVEFFYPVSMKMASDMMIFTYFNPRQLPQ